METKRRNTTEIRISRFALEHRVAQGISGPARAFLGALRRSQRLIFLDSRDEFKPIIQNGAFSRRRASVFFGFFHERIPGEQVGLEVDGEAPWSHPRAWPDGPRWLESSWSKARTWKPARFPYRAWQKDIVRRPSSCRAGLVGSAPG